MSEDVLQLTRQLNREPDISTALHILQWELGDLTKAYVHSTWRQHPKLQEGYKTEAKVALGDMLFQIRVISALYGLSMEELLELGEKRVENRVKERAKEKGEAILARRKPGIPVINERGGD